MATQKKDQKQTDSKNEPTETLWRKPIALNAFDDDDPLATLYRGRKASDEAIHSETTNAKAPESSQSKEEKSNVLSLADGVAAPEKNSKKTSRKLPIESQTIQESEKGSSPQITETALKDILKIKGESYNFTDLREILRGKSFDIYAYLCFLSGDTGICKIKHLDLMKKLEISRPTLFKQGEWLTRLSLIEKRNVPGDHLGTSYTVRRLENVLPIPKNLVDQLAAQIESFRNNDQ